MAGAPFSLRYFHKTNYRRSSQEIEALPYHRSAWAGRGAGRPRAPRPAPARLPWERAVGAKRRRQGEGCGGWTWASGGAHRCTHLPPERAGAGLGEPAACVPGLQAWQETATSSGGANEMQRQAEGWGASEKRPSCQNLKGAFSASPGTRQEPQRRTGTLRSLTPWKEYLICHAPFRLIFNTAARRPPKLSFFSQ